MSKVRSNIIFSKVEFVIILVNRMCVGVRGYERIRGERGSDCNSRKFNLIQMFFLNQILPGVS